MADQSIYRKARHATAFKWRVKKWIRYIYASVDGERLSLKYIYKMNMQFVKTAVDHIIYEFDTQLINESWPEREGEEENYQNPWLVQFMVSLSIIFT